MAADPVGGHSELQIRHIYFNAQMPHPKQLEQIDASFNRTDVRY
jgi:hypothetical protein